MNVEGSYRRLARRTRWRVTVPVAAAALTGALVAAGPASGAPVSAATGHGGFSGHHETWFQPGNLVVSGSYYTGQASLFTPGVTELPPGCSGSACTPAVAGGTYPGVFNNDAADGSFGVTSPIFLAQLTPDGHLVNVLRVPDGTGWGGASANHVVTSFSSKSELALNLSTNGRDLTFMGYDATPNTVDASNANTPGVIDPTNPVAAGYYRVVAEVNAAGHIHYTLTNAYSGDNGRAAILNNSGGDDVLYTAGNAGNGSTPEPVGVILGAGAQTLSPEYTPETAQVAAGVGQPTPLGSFNISQLGDKSDKIGKDTNFRGLTVYNNVVYYTKGSGGNGINTVYFIDTTGQACPGTGVGLPQPGAPLPTSAIAISDLTQIQTEGVQPYNMCVLKGFSTTLAKATTGVGYPFGLWFAGPDTLYVADEGDGVNTYSTSTGTYTDDAAQTTAGLQKWVFNGTQWNLAYTLTAGLNLGQPYTVPGYPAGDNSATGLPWAPATDGLRNITGRVNPDGTVTIYAVTSTVSGGGDQGADPNAVVAITDPLSATTPGPGEHFVTLVAPRFDVVLRGVSFTPGTRRAE
jgi:hypothetical protein